MPAREFLPPCNALSLASSRATVQQVPTAAAHLTRMLAGMRHTFAVSDALAPDCPLLYASDG